MIIWLWYDSQVKSISVCANRRSRLEWTQDLHSRNVIRHWNMTVEDCSEIVSSGNKWDRHIWRPIGCDYFIELFEADQWRDTACIRALMERRLEVFHAGALAMVGRRRMTWDVLFREWDEHHQLGDDDWWYNLQGNWVTAYTEDYYVRP